MTKNHRVLAALLTAVSMAACLSGCIFNEAAPGKGDANVQIKMEKIGALSKGSAIEMKWLILALSAPGENTLRDTLEISGTDQQSVLKSYENMSSKKTWTLQASTRDAGSITIHRDSVKFTVPAEGVANVNLNLKPRYSMLRASFYPIRDSVTRCELWVNGSLMADSSFVKQSLPSDTVSLEINYLETADTGLISTVEMKVFGNWYGTVGALLYHGQATFRVYPSQTVSYDLSLNWVAPLAPIGQGKLNVTLGAIGSVSMSGYLDDRFWKVLGNPGISPGQATLTSLRFDGDSVPYVAFQDGANGNKAAVMRWNGTGWTSVGTSGFSPGAALSLSFALSSDDVPYVAFQDAANANKATVMRWNGTDWLSVGTPGFSPGTAAGTSLAMINDTPHVAFQNGADSNKATVMRWNGTGWVHLGTSGFSPGTAIGTSLVVSNGVPYVAFQDEANGSKATVMRWNGTDWAYVGSAGVSSGIIDYITMAISDLDGTPYIGFRQGNRPTVMKWNGTSWSIVGKAAFSPGFLPKFSLSILNGRPYVAFQDGTQGTKISAMRWNGASWEIFGTPGFSTGIVDDVSFGFSPDGTGYVAFKDFTYGGRLSVMRMTKPTYFADYVGGDSL